MKRESGDINKLTIHIMKTIYITRNELFKNISMVLCNNINKVDDNFVEENMHLYQSECSECGGTGNNWECDECNGDGYNELEVYQTFLCDLPEWVVVDLTAWGVGVGYSEALDLHVIAIYDYGTGWSAFSYSKEVDDNYILGYNETDKRETTY